MEITHNGKTYQATGYIRRNLEDYINLKVEDIQEIKTEVPIRSYPIEKIVKKEEECKDHGIFVYMDRGKLLCENCHKDCRILYNGYGCEGIDKLPIVLTPPYKGPDEGLDMELVEETKPCEHNNIKTNEVAFCKDCNKYLLEEVEETKPTECQYEPEDSYFLGLKAMFPKTEEKIEEVEREQDLFQHIDNLTTAVNKLISFHNK